ncbi:E3 ubiquitin-protein ligase RBBP6 isoform X2 [Sphaeramia orbicularis]|uniref:E3 ubiquitin-protein ligase RBBP6 isoform X2 n=1 Tax=Sphaeramia orbicularis TaxID=375764 RepID=UPI00117D77C6|nr:E3 ubiquitin-protein ligase RBBP6 isoform X2 [Sphaeramia orbicularis]
MSHVHYKFSSKLSYDTVVFDDPNITLSDLKRQIMGREKLRAGDCDLQIVNAQNKEEYTDDQGSIPKGSSVIVRRIPFSGVKPSSTGKTHNTGRSDSHHNFGAFKAMDNPSTTGVLPFLSEMAILDNMDVSEEDKIKVLSQSMYDSSNYKKCGAGLPANYTCYRCGSTGHHIRNCPSVGQDKTSEAPLRIKRSTGIPRSFMVEVDDPGIKGAMLTNCGRYAIPAIDAKAYAVGKKEKPPFLQQEQPKSEGEDNPVPDELVCLICRDLLNDAVVIPCCGNSYCDDCIRSALLDSEEHVCPTCNQLEVSPDTLIANKFLRQAVNNYKKEQGYTRTIRRTSCPSQSQTPTTTPSPVPTPPPLYSHIQPPKPQQDPLLHCSEATDPPSVSQESDTAPIVTSPVSASNTPTTFLQLEESHVESPDKCTHREDDGGTHNAPAGSPSVLVSNTVSTSTPSQLIPLVTDPPVVDQPQSVTVHPDQSSQSAGERQTDLLSTTETCGLASAHSGQTACWESSSSSSTLVCPSGSWTKFSAQQLPSSSSPYSAAQPPLYPPVQFHTFLRAQQPLSSYPPVYPMTTPLWTLPTPRAAPIPSLCSSPSTSSIASLIPKEWFRHQRQKNERSPHRGSTYRHSSSQSKSSKYKSSRSYSRSSSRSRSRSRSQSRSRPPSPKSNHRDNASRYHSSHSYNYGYKHSRSPTPSSSSSSRVHHRSRSPSDQRKSQHHSRHHSRRSSSRSSSSRRRGNCSSASSSSHRETGNSEWNLDGYLQWKQEYNEWCEKYFNSYVGHFHQLPPPPPTPPPQPHWGKNSKKNYHPHSGHSFRRDGYSPASQWSSESHSPPSQSSSESSSMSSQFSSDSRSTPSQTSNDSCSPPSQSCTDSYSVPSREGAHLGANSSTKDRKEVEMQQIKGGKPVTTNIVRDKQQNTGRDAYVEDSPAQEETTSDASQLDQPPLKPDKNVDKGCERKKKEKKTSDKERGSKRGKDFDSRRDMEKHYKVKSSRGAGSTDSDRNRRPRGSKTPDSKSERSRKRKGDDMQRNESEKILTEDHCRESLKTKLTEEPQTHESESPKRFDRDKKKKEFWNAQPASEEDIWEGGIKVKPQKKISININLDGKRKQEDTEKHSQSSSERIEGKSQETTEDINHGEEKEKLNRRETDLDVNARSDSVREKKVVFERKIKPDGETRERLERAAFRDKKNEMWDSFIGEDGVGERKGTGEEEEFDLWHCALRGVKEEEDKTVLGQGGQKRRAEKEHKMGDDGRKTDTGDLPLTHQKEWINEDTTGQQRRMSIEDEAPPSQRSRNCCDKLNPAVDNSRTSSSVGKFGGEHHHRTMTMVKSLNEYTESRAAGKLDELILTQVPHSRWDKEESEGEQDNGETEAQTCSFPSPRPPVSATPADRKTEGENESKQQRLVELDRDRARAMEKREGMEKEGKSSLERNVAPSSGKHRTDSSFNTDKKREERDRESSRKRQKESKSSKEKIREKERGRDRERESRNSSTYSTHSSSTYNFIQILEEDGKKKLYEAARREKHQERNKNRERSSSYSASGGSRESHSISRAAELLSHNMHRAHRNLLQDLQCKVKDEESKHPSHQSLHSHSRSQGRERGLLHFKPPRESSPDWESTYTPPKDQWKHRRQCLSSQDLSLERGGEKEERTRNESGRERREWSPWKVDKAMKGNKQERQMRRSEEERSSSSISSPASLEDSKDNRGDEKKRQKTHKKEKRHPTSELEEVELMNSIKKKSKEGEKKESRGETDIWWKEEEDSVMLT